MAEVSMGWIEVFVRNPHTGELELTQIPIAASEELANEIYENKHRTLFLTPSPRKEAQGVEKEKLVRVGELEILRVIGDPEDPYRCEPVKISVLATETIADVLRHDPDIKEVVVHLK